MCNSCLSALSSSSSRACTFNLTCKKARHAQHRLHFLRILKKKGLDSNLMLTFYHMSIESLRAYCFTVCRAHEITKNSSRPGFRLLDLPF
ncbi:hypothetical protein CHARACLAT_033425 [Characodon lateralis]|uniref:Alkylated DNA repair protein AlkB homologue 8 N-terminal domain-containing protein n=1 Tax=Characodon lateralis TaxID=208331 RepID=A0ABU7CU27_9TELE|nr:hypothetical protein [Characodon lateralis]